MDPAGTGNQRQGPGAVSCEEAATGGTTGNECGGQNSRADKRATGEEKDGGAGCADQRFARSDRFLQEDQSPSPTGVIENTYNGTESREFDSLGVAVALPNSCCDIDPLGMAVAFSIRVVIHWVWQCPPPHAYLYAVFYSTIGCGARFPQFVF